MSQTGYTYIQCAVITDCDGTKNYLSYMTDLLQEPALQKYTAANSELRQRRTFGFRKMAPHADTIEKSLFINTKETSFYSFLQHILSNKIVLWLSVSLQPNIKKYIKNKIL